MPSCFELGCVKSGKLYIDHFGTELIEIGCLGTAA